MKDDLTPNNTEIFNKIISIIYNARKNAFRAINKELINMYWSIGENVSLRVSESNWGKSSLKIFRILYKDIMLAYRAFHHRILGG